MQTKHHHIQITSSRIQRSSFRNDFDLLTTLFSTYKEQFLAKTSEKSLQQLQQQLSAKDRTKTALSHGNELEGLYSSK